MANQITSAVKQHWADMFQENLEKDLLGMELCSLVNIPNGDTKNLPTINLQRYVQYQKYTPVTSQEIKTGNDQIVINRTPMVPFEIDRIDVDDAYLEITPELISGAGYVLKSAVDGDILNKALEAKHVYNSAGLDQWAGDPIALTTANLAEVVGKARTRLVSKGVNPQNLALVVDTDNVDLISNLGIEKGFNVADEAFARGYRGNFKALQTYETNNLTATRTLALATNPTADDTITILGNTFKFVSALANAGDVLIGADVAATTANLIAAVNVAAGEGTTYIGQEDPSELIGVTASAVTGGVLFTSLTGRMFASSNLTAAADKFGVEAVEAMVMEKGAIKLALRNSVEIKQDSDPDSLVEKFKVWSRYGVAVTSKGKAKMVRISIQWDAAE